LPGDTGNGNALKHFVAILAGGLRSSGESVSPDSSEKIILCLLGASAVNKTIHCG
jgi:hypothetical protein